VRLFDVEHQWAAQRRLQMARASGRIPHAYLFAGPVGVGKQMLAERFGRLLLCSKPVKLKPPAEAGGAKHDWFDACGTCEECVMLAAGTHPDYRVLHRGYRKFHPEAKVQRQKGLELTIDLVRHFVLEQINKRAARGRAKVFVIGEAERLNPEAQNAMLKTLEEPPDDTFLILIARSAERLLSTIRSRCQPVAFGPLPSAFVAARLAERQIAGADATYLAELSEGSLGQALRYASLGLAPRRGEVVGLLEGAGRDPLAAAKQIKETAEGLGKPERDEEAGEVGEVDTDAVRTALKTVLAMTACLLRDALRVASGAEAVAYESDPAVRKVAGRLGKRGAMRGIRAIATAESQIDMNANVPLVLDGLAISLSRCFEGATAVA